MARIASFLLLLVFVSCGPTDEQLSDALAPVRERFAPDRRVAVFTVTAERRGGTVIAKGEVDNPDAKREALETLRTVGGNVVDSVVVLPQGALAEKPYGIVTVSVGNMRSMPGHAQELATQVLMGMVLKILKEERGWYFVQSHDRYLGWIEGSSMQMTDEKGREEWIDGPKLLTPGTSGS